MNDERLKKCNEIRSTLSSLESKRNAIANSLTLSIDHMTLCDQDAVDAAKKAVLAIYDARIEKVRKEYENA